jgi:hypothetical protein
MCYRKGLRQVYRARRRAKAQQRALPTLELECFVALTLHTVTKTLTVPIERAVGAQVADALRERRQALKTEAGQLQRDGGENDYRRGKARAGSAIHSLVTTPLPGEIPNDSPSPVESPAPQS